MTEKNPTAVYLVWGLILLLIILHQDNWLWNNGTLVFGFIPVGLFFHACISVAASMTWLIATKYAWPTTFDFPEDSSSSPETKGAAK